MRGSGSDRGEGGAEVIHSVNSTPVSAMTEAYVFLI